MKKANETVIDYVVREITSCMAFKPIIYLETEDHSLLNRLLNRRDCFSIFKKNSNGSVSAAEYNEDDVHNNTMSVVNKLTGASILCNAEKLIQTFSKNQFILLRKISILCLTHLKGS